jgi:S-phase kinase-associated protein 1
LLNQKIDFLIFVSFIKTNNQLAVKMSSLNLEDDAQQLNITLTSQDGFSVEIPLEWCKLSKLITETVESDAECKQIAFGEHIPCKEYLEVIVQYLTMCKGVAPSPIEEPLEFAEMSKVTTSENAQFIDTLYSTKGIYFLYDTISVANYLAINSLLNLTCAKVASIIKNQPLKDLPAILNPQNKPKKNFGFSSLEDGKVVFLPPSQTPSAQAHPEQEKEQEQPSCAKKMKTSDEEMEAEDGQIDE